MSSLQPSEVLDPGEKKKERSSLNEVKSPTTGCPAGIKRVVALGDYESTGPGILTIREHDIVDVIQQGSDSGWWTGRVRGEVGYFPISYCRFVQEHKIDTSVVTPFIQLMQKRCGLLPEDKALLLHRTKTKSADSIIKLQEQLLTLKGFPTARKYQRPQAQENQRETSSSDVERKSEQQAKSIDAKEEMTSNATMVEAATLAFVETNHKLKHNTLGRPAFSGRKPPTSFQAPPQRAGRRSASSERKRRERGPGIEEKQKKDRNSNKESASPRKTKGQREVNSNHKGNQNFNKDTREMGKITKDSESNSKFHSPRGTTGKQGRRGKLQVSAQQRETVKQQESVKQKNVREYVVE